MWSEPNGLALLRRESVQIMLLAAFALGVYLPSHRSHWLREAEGDERGQIEVSRGSLHHILSTYQSGQNHPLYGILAHLTIRAMPVRDTYAARLPALLAGLAIPIAFYYTHRNRVGRTAALLVAYVLVAADPLHYYAAAARGYTLMVLGVLLANHLLLEYLREGRPAVLAAYTLAATAAGYSHLWGALIVPAHAAFLVIDRFWDRVVGRQAEGETRRQGAGVALSGRLAISPSPCPRVPPSALLAGSAIALAALLITVLYLPMVSEIRAMAGHRGEAPLGLIDKVLGLASFRSWTTAGYVLLVPLALEGVARRLQRAGTDRPRGAGLASAPALSTERPPDRETFVPTSGSVGRPATTDAAGPDRAVWLHVTLFVCVLILTTVTHPANFYRRFLMVLIPSGAALAAWCFAGTFTDRRSLAPSRRPLPAGPLLPLPTTWLAGFALGVLVSNTSMSSFMSWQFRSHTDAGGRDHGYYYRNLPKAVESLGGSISVEIPVAVVLVVGAAFAMVWHIRRSAPWPVPNRRNAYMAVYLWTGLLLVGLVPLVLGPHSTPGRLWLFEFHTIAAATLCLLAWCYRGDARLLRALRYGLLLTALVLVYWQLGVEQPRLDGSALLRVAALVPPALATVGMLCAGKTRDAG